MCCSSALCTQEGLHHQAGAVCCRRLSALCACAGDSRWCCKMHHDTLSYVSLKLEFFQAILCTIQGSATLPTTKHPQGLTRLLPVPSGGAVLPHHSCNQLGQPIPHHTPCLHLLMTASPQHPWRRSIPTPSPSPQTYTIQILPVLSHGACFCTSATKRQTATTSDGEAKTT